MTARQLRQEREREANLADQQHTQKTSVSKQHKFIELIS